MQKPALYAKRGNNRPEQLGGELGISNGGNTFNDHVFVVLTAGALAAVASGGTSTCGFVLDVSQASAAANPPTAMFGNKHFPVNLGGQRFSISVTDASGNVGAANGAPQMSEITIGEKYGILKRSNGDHALNVDNTTDDFFVVVEKPGVANGTKQDANTYNPVVIVEVIDAVRQTI